jgi:hypothetical protein
VSLLMSVGMRETGNRRVAVMRSQVHVTRYRMVLIRMLLRLRVGCWEGPMSRMEWRIGVSRNRRMRNWGSSGW